MPGISRRQFLYGAGGFTLALPFLPSILPKAIAAGPSTRPKRLFTMFTPHGGVAVNNWYPAVLPSEAHELYPGWTMHEAPLVLGPDGISPALRTHNPLGIGSPDELTAELVSKMNLYRGIDFTFYLAHLHQHILGNYAKSIEDGLVVIPDIPTIDHVLAQSGRFYPDLSSVRQRLMTMSSDRSRSLTHDGSQAVPVWTSSHDLFDAVFGADTGSEGEESSGPGLYVVDRVLEHFRSLTGGAFGQARRLSGEDRGRLQEHMEKLYELERQIRITSPSCDTTRPTEEARWFPGSESERARWCRNYLDVVTRAFACGASRIASLNLWETFIEYSGDWHQDVAHAHDQEAPQQLIVRENQFIFEYVFMYLVSRLDEISDDPVTGETVLDNTLVVWQHEHGPYTHHGDSVATLSAGGGGGAIRTGRYFDFRDRDNDMGMYKKWHDPGDRRPGLPHNRWLVTILQAMGLAPEDYERTEGEARQPGYGSLVQFSDHEGDERRSPYPYPEEVMADRHLPLPRVMK